MTTWSPFNKAPYNTFSEKFDGLWTEKENPFSDPQIRAIGCLNEIDRCLFHSEVEKANALFQKCKEKEAWNAYIGINVDSPFRNLQNIQIACDRIHTNTAQILEDAKEKQTLEQIKAKIQELIKETQDPIKNTEKKVLEKRKLSLEYKIAKKNLERRILQDEENKKRRKLDEAIAINRIFRDLNELNRLELYNYFFTLEIPPNLQQWFFKTLQS